jgi:outer membrane protein assembly factor BamD
MAGFFLENRNLLRAVLCAFLAGPFCLGAKGQTVQPQTGSSGPGQATQGQADQSQPSPDQKKDQKKDDKDKKQPPTARTPQKKIKAHVVKADEKKKKNDVDISQSAEPDKVLYERALADVKKGRYTEGRLSLQALINTYPDSEYLAKAKLAVADSYYKEGGTSNLTQSIDEYKNFIIFFPFLDEAAYAQMQIGMAHFRMVEKSDRDTTQAQEAEQEFQTFLLKYPQSPLVAKAEQNLRNVQEVLADGEYRIARFYFLKQDFPASAARLIEVSERYPLYSQSDEALWMLGDVYSVAKQKSRNEDDKNHWADLAAKCYDRIVQNYPLSHLAPTARSRLKAMGMPVPPPDPDAAARMKKEQMYQKEHHQTAFLRWPLGMLKSGPAVVQAAHSGPPNLNPPNDAVSAKEVLIQGAKGPDFDQANKPTEDTSQSASGDTTPVEAVPTSPGAAPQGTGVGVQIITPPADPNAQPANSQTPPANSTAPANPSQPNPPATSNAPDASNPPATPPASANPGSAPAANTSAPVQPTPPPDSPTPAAVQGGNGSADPPAANGANTQSKTQGAGQPNAQDAQGDKQKPAQADKADPKTESTSKKKKGIRKVIPW